MLNQKWSLDILAKTCWSLVATVLSCVRCFQVWELRFTMVYFSMVLFFFAIVGPWRQGRLLPMEAWKDAPDWSEHRDPVRRPSSKIQQQPAERKIVCFFQRFENHESIEDQSCHAGVEVTSMRQGDTCDRQAAAWFKRLRIAKVWGFEDNEYLMIFEGGANSMNHGCDLNDAQKVICQYWWYGKYMKVWNGDYIYI